MRLFCLLVASLVALSQAIDSNTTRVIVQIPWKLHNPDGEAHHAADFGFAPHTSGSLSAYVHFSKEHAPYLCNPVGNRSEFFNMEQRGFAYILLADRGGCSFVTKARNAQQAGAAALVVADTTCRCDNKPCMDAQKGDGCQEHDPALVDDGSGSDVSIPTFLLAKLPADNVKHALGTGQKVLMELAWGLKNETVTSVPVPTYHLWTSARDELLDLPTLKNLQLVTHKVGPSKIQFAPRYALIDGNNFDCTQQADTDGPCDHLCTNHGRYCAIHARNLSGHAIVRETLRQLCIWKHYHEAKPDIWWDYVIHHREHCHEPSLYADEACVNKALQYAKADKAAIETCEADSGGLDEDGTNSLLQEMLDHHSRSGVVALPALTLDYNILEQTSSRTLFEAICMHYWYSNDFETVPDICYTCGTCPNVWGCLEQGHCVGFSPSKHHHSQPSSGQQQGKSGHHGWSTFFWICTIGACCAGFYYYKKQQQDGSSMRMSDQEGAGLLTSYFQLT